MSSNKKIGNVPPTLFTVIPRVIDLVMKSQCRIHILLYQHLEKSDERHPAFPSDNNLLVFALAYRLAILFCSFSEA